MNSENTIKTFIIKGFTFNNENEIEDNCKILTLNHPKHKIPTKFYLNDCKLYELLTLKFATSFFIDDTSHSNAEFILSNQIDPIFIVLPYLKAKNNDYLTLNDMLIDRNYPDISQIKTCIGLEYLHLIADKMEDKYKYNKDKVLKWLNNKYNNLLRVLEKKFSDDVIISQEANGIFSQYLDEEIFKVFLSTQNTKKRKSSPDQIPQLFKKQKLQ